MPIFHDTTYTRRDVAQRLFMASLYPTQGDGTCFFESMARVLMNDLEPLSPALSRVRDRLERISKGNDIDTWKNFLTGHLVIEKSDTHVGKAYNAILAESLARSRGAKTDDMDVMAHTLAEAHSAFKKKKTGVKTKSYHKMDEAEKHRAHLEALFDAYEKYKRNRRVYADEPQIRRVLDTPEIRDHFIILILMTKRVPNEEVFDLTPTPFPVGFFQCMSAEELRWTAKELCADPVQSRKRIAILVRSELEWHTKEHQDLRSDVHYQPLVFHMDDAPPELSKPVCRLCDDALLVQVVQGYMDQCVELKKPGAKVAVTVAVPSTPIKRKRKRSDVSSIIDLTGEESDEDQ